MQTGSMPQILPMETLHDCCILKALRTHTRTAFHYHILHHVTNINFCYI